MTVSTAQTISGTWTDINGDQATIAVNGAQVTINIPNRPAAQGTVIFTDPYVLRINFPDNELYIGTLINTNQIQWVRLGILLTNNVWTR